MKKMSMVASQIIAKLNLQPHPEGGFYAECNRDKSLILNKSDLPPQCNFFLSYPHSFLIISSFHSPTFSYNLLDFSIICVFISQKCGNPFCSSFTLINPDCISKNIIKICALFCLYFFPSPDCSFSQQTRLIALSAPECTCCFRRGACHISIAFRAQKPGIFI